MKRDEENVRNKSNNWQELADYDDCYFKVPTSPACGKEGEKEKSAPFCRKIDVITLYIRVTFFIIITIVVAVIILTSAVYI